MNAPLTRRRLLVQALVGADLVAAPGLPHVLATPDLLVANVTQLYSVRVARIATPRSADDVAKEEVFSFVLYHKQRTHARAQKAVGVWTRVLIDLVLRCEGRYYLPYQLHATRQQFDNAYPEARALRELKQRVDPRGVFSNELWARYL